ncbi:MAG: efflux RND transporter permease subunit, partial [Proteobacteria bacterium]|nr:efflux RND transporter permease subunit [Pseudomonadota bacterium]
RHAKLGAKVERDALGRRSLHTDRECARVGRKARVIDAGDEVGLVAGRANGQVQRPLDARREEGERQVCAEPDARHIVAAHAVAEPLNLRKLGLEQRLLAVGRVADQEVGAERRQLLLSEVEGGEAEDVDRRGTEVHADIGRRSREPKAKLRTQAKAVTKVLEIPPGPPVLATMMAEVYGPDRATREKVAAELYGIFKSENSVVDLDSTLRTSRPRLRYGFDFDRGGRLGVNAELFAALGRGVFSESRIGLVAESGHPEEIGIDLSLAQNARSGNTPLKDLTLPSFETGSVDASLLSRNPIRIENPTLYRKNLKPVSYVMSELSGSEEAPVYGMLKLAPKIHYPAQTAEVPWNTTEPVIKWDGEWFITYEVFRDLGGAFAVVIVLIYVLVLGWFRSYAVPLIIMAPIPISLIGILPGHAILSAYFTATSMIGFIAGAGIIVRNSIILVDFIEHQIRNGHAVKDAVISAGVLRFRPMLLTAAAVVAGSAVMLADPIFQGLAVSLMFGEVAATLLSRFAVPVLYYWFAGKSRERVIRTEQNQQEES